MKSEYINENFEKLMIECFEKCIDDMVDIQKTSTIDKRTLFKYYFSANNKEVDDNFLDCISEWRIDWDFDNGKVILKYKPYGWLGLGITTKEFVVGKLIGMIKTQDNEN